MANIKKKLIAGLTLIGLLSLNITNVSAITNEDNIQSVNSNLQVENTIFSIQKKYFKKLNDNLNNIDKEYIQKASDYLTKGNYDKDKLSLNYNTSGSLSGVVSNSINKTSYKFNLKAKNDIRLNFNKGIIENTDLSYNLNDQYSRIKGHVIYEGLFTKNKINENNYFINFKNASFDDKLVYSDTYYKLYGIDKASFEKTSNALKIYENTLLDVKGKTLGTYNKDLDNFFKEFDIEKFNKMLNSAVDQNLIKNNLEKIRKTKKELFILSQKEAIFKIYKNDGNKYYFTINPIYIDFLKKVNKEYNLRLDREDNLEKIFKEGKITDTMLKYMEIKGYNAIKLNDDKSLTFLQLEKRNSEIDAFYLNFNKDKINTFLFAIKKKKSNELFLTYLKDDKINLLIKEKSTYSIKNAYVEKCSKTAKPIPSVLFAGLDLKNNDFKFNYNMAQNPLCEKGKININSIKFTGNGNLLSNLNGKAELIKNKKVIKKLGSLEIKNNKKEFGYKLYINKFNPNINNQCSFSLNNDLSLEKENSLISAGLKLNISKCEDYNVIVKGNYKIKFNFDDNSSLFNSKINEISKLKSDKLIKPEDLMSKMNNTNNIQNENNELKEIK